MSSRRGKTPDPFLSSASSSSATMQRNAGNNSNRTWLIVLIIIAVVILWLFNDSKSTPMPAPVSQASCAVSAKQRESALGQKGATMWMTGLSGSGKSTIGKELERRLVLNDKVHMYRLDGDNMRFGLSRDLKLTPEDRKESVRRAGEVASLMADSGTLTLVSLISPYQRDRDAARTLHEEKGLAFLEVYVEAPTSEVEKRDPKGLYKSHREGKLRGVPGFDAPYEAPAHPEILLKTQECCGDRASEQKLSVCKTEADAAGTKFQAHCPKALDECVGACVDKLRSELIRLQVVQPKAGQPAAIAALGQKGATMWMTGLSGSGKSTIGKELERRLVLNDKVHMYRLDGHNMRFGLSRDLKLTPEDRKEAVRRAGEVASLMADSGTLTLVSLISPYQRDRDAARTLHEEKGLAFLEVYVEAPTSEVEKRDPKGLYKSHREGKLRGVTGFDAPYEAPAHPEILLKTQECCGDRASEQKLSVCKTEADAAGTKFQAHCPKALDECVGACVDKLRSELIRLQVVQPKAGQPATIIRWGP